MSVPVEEAIAALSTFSLEDDQPDLQGLAILLSSERCATSSSIEYGDVSAYRLSLAEDTKSVNQLNSLTKEGKEMASILYTYRSCVKALPQLPDSMKNSQADLYLETYQVLDSEMGRLREIQRWQSSAASKLAGDMQRFSRPERLLNGPTATHIWSMLKLLDVLVQLDHLKNAKASIPNDFSWYKRTFTQVSIQWQDTDSMREELDDLQIFLSTRWAILLNFHAEMFRISSVEDILQVLIVFCVELLELEFHFALLFPDRHMLLRVLPVLLVLASSSEKDIESLYKRVKINRLISIFKNDPVIPAFPDLHLSPAAIMKELSMYFPNFSSQTRLLTIPSPHEIGPRELQEYQRRYLVINHIDTIRSEHNDFVIRFATATNQIILLKSADDVDLEWSKEVKGCMYDMVVEGFQLLSRWTSRVWEQSAWKFSRPCKDAPTSEDNQTPVFDYEKVVRWNYSSEEREALLEVIGYIKSVGSMMQRRDTLVADALWETIHIEVQDFVQDKLDAMLRTSFRKKKDLSRILSDMRTISADWIAGTCKHEADHSQQNENEASKTNTLYPRSVPPTAAQVHCLQFLICELVTGGNLRKNGGLFGNSSSGIPNDDLKQLETFFYKLSFFLHILDYSATLITLTDLGFLWFREFYLESSRVIQFPIECSLPWMLMHHVIESQDEGLFESVLMPFDIYNDSAQHALTVLKQRFLYDEIEAEVDLCFDQLVFMISESIFSHYKSRAASEMLDKYFLSSSEKYSIRPIRFKELLKMRRVQILGRTIDLRSLITQRMNKLIRDNVDALFEHFENQDLCAIVELHKLLDILSLTHQLLSENLQLDSFHLILNEMQENLSLVSFSSRLSSQIWSELQNDFLPNFILCNTTQRFVRSTRVAQKSAKSISLPGGKSYFHCGSQDLTMAYNSMTELYSEFFGIPHMLAIVKILGPRSLPWLIRSLLDLISEKITVLVSKISGLQEALPKAIGLLSFDGGITGCQKYVHDQLTWASKTELKKEVLQGMKELGSILYLMSLLDIVLREVETEQFMQTAPWLGFVTGNDGQLKQCANSGDSPLVNLFKSATSAVISNHRCLSPASFFAMSKQAEAADLFYKTNMQSGSVLEYAFAFTSAVLEKNYSKWSAQPRTGFVDITTTKDFYRIYSGLMFEYMEEISQDPSKDSIGDSAAWGACTIIYLLGQQLQFELFDFSHQLLNVAESEVNSVLQAVSSDRNRGASYLQAGHDNLFEAMKKSRRLNNYVFSVLKARCPLEEKIACAIRQSGAPVHRIRFVNAVSSFETLPQKKGA